MDSIVIVEVGLEIESRQFKRHSAVKETWEGDAPAEPRRLKAVAPSAQQELRPPQQLRDHWIDLFRINPEILEDLG